MTNVIWYPRQQGKSQALQLSEYIEKLIPVAKAVVKGFEPDPGTSDLDDEQPIHVCIPLGVYRKAQSIVRELKP